MQISLRTHRRLLKREQELIDRALDLHFDWMDADGEYMPPELEALFKRIGRISIQLRKRTHARRKTQGDR